MYGFNRCAGSSWIQQTLRQPASTTGGYKAKPRARVRECLALPRTVQAAAVASPAHVLEAEAHVWWEKADHRLSNWAHNRGCRPNGFTQSCEDGSKQWQAAPPPKLRENERSKTLATTTAAAFCIFWRCHLKNTKKKTYYVQN